MLAYSKYYRYLILKMVFCLLSLTSIYAFMENNSLLFSSMLVILTNRQSGPLEETYRFRNNPYFKPTADIEQKSKYGHQPH